MNRKYGKINLEGLEYAPSALIIDGRTIFNPSAASYAAAGYLPVVNNPAPSDAPQGKHYEFRAYEVIDGEIRWAYALVDDPPPPPREFSKLKVVAALTQAGVWHEVKDYIEGAGLYDLYLAAQDFREDNPYFTSGKAQLMASLGWTEEQAEALLSQCVMEGV